MAPYTAQRTQEIPEPMPGRRVSVWAPKAVRPRSMWRPIAAELLLLVSRCATLDIPHLASFSSFAEEYPHLSLPPH